MPVDPKYRALKEELILKALSHYTRQTREEVVTPYFFKGKCHAWSQKFVETFPELSLKVGFIGHNEHYWCQLADGTIIDPTVEQFYFPEWQGDPSLYRELNEEEDHIYLGKCMNCGEELYGLKKEGRQEVCRPEEGEEESECSRALTAYFNDEIAMLRSSQRD